MLVLVLLSIKKSELDSKNMRVKTVVLKANNTTLVKPSKNSTNLTFPNLFTYCTYYLQ